MSPQERVARDYLAQGRFRKARDEFKLLCKVDRQKFLPFLVEANVGLAREMMGKGMVEDARQVVSYLKTIAPPGAVLALELEVGAGPREQRPVIQDVLEAIAKAAPGTDERQRLADRAVLMFETVTDLSPEVAALALELEAVGSALRAISERQLDRALDLVRPLGQSSVFSHWKVFIKGLAAFHSGEKEKAARFFSGLPAASAPGKAGQAYLLLLGPAPVAPASLPSASVLEAACRLAGEPGCGEALLRAEQDWRKGNAAQMYLSLRNGIRRFPSVGRDLLGVLSEFAINCYSTLPNKAKNSYITLVCEAIVRRGRAKSPVEELLFLRMTLLEAIPIIPDPMALDYLDRYLRIHKQLHGPDSAFDSMAYGWLGKIMSEPPSSHASPFGGVLPPSSYMRNPSESQRLLEKALNLDGSNLPASLNLCEVYQREGLNAERDRLLDVMAARFSKDKKVLVLVAQACIDRKAPKKALDYLYQALEVDRLDPEIPNLLVKTWLFRACEQFQNGKPDLARRSLDETARFELPTPGNLHRSAWCLKIQRGLMESTWGDQPRGRALLDEARRESPSVAAFLYYAGFAGLHMGRQGRKHKAEYFKEFARLLKREANAADGVLLTRIWSHEELLIPEERSSETDRLMVDYLRAAAKRPFAREDACRLVEFGLAEEGLEEAATFFVGARLREDARDPAFRLYELQLEEWSPEWCTEEDRDELEEILAEAILRKDDQSIRQARQKLDSIKLSPSPPPPSSDPGMRSVFEDDDDFEEDPSDFGGDPIIKRLVAGLTPGQQEIMLGLLHSIVNASDSELQEFKRTRPPELSGADFDMLANLLRRKDPLGTPNFGPSRPPLPKLLPKQAPPPKPSPRPRLLDPNQPELFSP